MDDRGGYQVQKTWAGLSTVPGTSCLNSYNILERPHFADEASRAQKGGAVS